MNTKYDSRYFRKGLSCGELIKQLKRYDEKSTVMLPVNIMCERMITRITCNEDGVIIIE